MKTPVDLSDEFYNETQEIRAKLGVSLGYWIVGKVDDCRSDKTRQWQENECQRLGITKKQHNKIIEVINDFNANGIVIEYLAFTDWLFGER